MCWFQQAEKQLQRNDFHISETIDLCKSTEFTFFKQEQSVVRDLSNSYKALYILAVPVFDTYQDTSYINSDVTLANSQNYFL